MCGVYTDNQPDFSWIEVDEEKSFEQYFFPYAGIGAVKNATNEAAINIEEKDDTVWIKVYATSTYEGATITLTINGENIFATAADLSPENIYIHSIHLPANTVINKLNASVYDLKGKCLVDYKKASYSKKDIPPPATPALQPAEIENNELLFINGLHLEQYRHATFSPVDYYEEALKRDPLDTRCNNAMGLWNMRRGKFEEAEVYFRNVISRLIARNPNRMKEKLFII